MDDNKEYTGMGEAVNSEPNPEAKALEDKINKRKAYKAKQKKRRILFFGIIIVLVCAFTLRAGKVKEDRTVEIKEGSSLSVIADTLKDEGVISNKFRFIVQVIVSGNKSAMRFGKYDFKKGMDYGDIIDVMIHEGAKKETVTLTVPEGFSVENIKDRMIELGIGTEETVQAALKADYPFEFISKIPVLEGQTYRLEGFLFPSTYEFFSDVTPEKVIETMLSEFEKQYRAAGGSIENIYEVITKASMVEREAKLDSERPVIAGVFENRIKKGMRLQIDATVAYVISGGKYNVERVLYSDLKNPSPYNTYEISGLPLGPIANPGAESIKAALNPAVHDYLFYHTDETKNDGSHIFTVDFEQHKNTME